MAKVIMICGKICSGKSTYANCLCSSRNAVILSADEMMLAIFGPDAGDQLDHYVKMTKKYLYHKSLDIIKAGVDVILDWGFWTKNERTAARIFFAAENIDFEFHYIDICDADWNIRLKKRNQDVIEKNPMPTS